MANRQRQTYNLADSTESDNRNPSVIYIPGSFGHPISGEHYPWAYGQRFTHTIDGYRNIPQSSDKLFLSPNRTGSVLCTEDDLQKSSVNMSPPLPQWIWTILVTTLGIGPNASQKRYCIATLLHVLTLASAFMFGASGLFFNAYDTVSKFTRTTVLVSVAKSVLGLYWIGLGIYANIIAARLFNNKRMVDCIQLHSKTFLKVSTAFIVMMLSVAMVIINLYSNQYLLHDQKPSNETSLGDANCASLDINVLLCKIYFASKVVYSCFCLLWNLLIVGIFLSVCRTHTISIRRFMKKLLYDTKIYVEFCRIQALERQADYLKSQSGQGIQSGAPSSDLLFASDTTNIWDDDIVGFDRDTPNLLEVPSNAELLNTLRLVRINTGDQLASDFTAGVHNQDVYTSDTTPFAPWIDEEENEISDDSKDAVLVSSHHSDGTRTRQSPDPHPTDDGQEQPVPQAGIPKKSISNTREENENREKDQFSYEKPSRQQSRTTLSDMSPPIMDNEELLFTYFQLLRRFSSTSRLLQRWISNWITFVMLWCALLVVYWTNHTAQLNGISQFLIPLVTLGLLTSGYAEVNFESERLLKCIMPTEHRMPVFYYFQKSKLELKIFSFTMTYNTIVTVVAGIAVTFATRIILDQFNLGKGI